MAAQDAKKAKSYALRLLKLRPRSAAEIRGKMADKGHAAAAIDATVEALTQAGLLDDAVFAKAWMRSRLNRPMGLRRVSRELMDKGISKDLVRAAWDELKEDYDELDVVCRLANKRAAKYNNIDPLKRKKRVMDYLARRGFQLDAIMKAIRAL
jgi:regulatory protein